MVVLFLIILLFLNALQRNPPPTLIHRRDEGPTRFRTTYDIVWSCLLTIFACVWTSGHPNIAAPRDSGWTRLKRRVIMMVYALIAPEMVVFWAMRQYAAALWIASDYNKVFIIREPVASQSFHSSSDYQLILHVDLAVPELSLWQRVKRWVARSTSEYAQSTKEWWTIAPESAVRRVPGRPWSQSHGFFIQMGGFVLYENGMAKQVLVYDDFKRLVKAGAIEAPIITDSDIQDRSKGDAISKGFVVLQTTWFMLQCIGRKAQDLPLCELEVVTLGFAVLNAIVYAMWWNKPQGVDNAICIPLKDATDVADIIRRPMDTARQIAEQGAGLLSFFSPWTMPNPYEKYPPRDEEHAQDHEDAEVYNPMDDEIVAQLLTEDGPQSTSHHQAHIPQDPNAPSGWLGRQLLKDRFRFARGASALLFFLRIPYRFAQFTLRPLAKMGNSDTVPAGALRVPMFYADSRAVLGPAYLASCAIGVLFGAVHLLAWSATFATAIERALWRVSAVVITVVPGLTIAGMPSFVSLSRIRKHKRFRRFSKAAKFMQVAIPAVLGIPFYILARFTLLGLALISLRELPPGAHIAVSWTSFIPHI